MFCGLWCVGSLVDDRGLGWCYMPCSWIITTYLFGKNIHRFCTLRNVLCMSCLFINAWLKEQASSSVRIFSLRNLVFEELLLYLCIKARFCLCYELSVVFLRMAAWQVFWTFIPLDIYAPFCRLELLNDEAHKQNLALIDATAWLHCPNWYGFYNDVSVKISMHASSVDPCMWISSSRRCMRFLFYLFLTFFMSLSKYRTQIQH
jgi:hypothetical protein